MHTWEACRITFAANTRTLGKANAFTDIFSYDRHTCFFFFLFLVWRDFQGATRKAAARDKLRGSFACCLRKEKKMLTVFILQRIEANDRVKAGSISQHLTLFEFRIFLFSCCGCTLRALFCLLVFWLVQPLTLLPNGDSQTCFLSTAVGLYADRSRKKGVDTTLFSVSTS